MPTLEYSHLSEDRIDDMIEVVTRSRESMPLERRITREEAAALTFRDPDFDPRATWLVTSDGVAVGYGSATVDSNRVGAGKDDGRVEIEVVPAFRGVGIEDELLARALEYLRSRGIGTVLSRTMLDDEWRTSFLSFKGFSEYYRIYELMRRGRTELPPVILPEGYSLGWKLFKEHSEAEVEAWVEAFNASFFDHVNFAPELPERFVNWRDGTSDPIMLSAVRKEGAIVGICLTEESGLYNRERGLKVGWINIVGVRPAHRRKGLARALLVEGMSWLLEKGMDTIYIGVVSQNASALQLYTSLGFEKEHESVWLRRSVIVSGSDGKEQPRQPN